MIAKTEKSPFLAKAAQSVKGLSWLCYYGPDREVLKLPGYQLLILEADALGPLSAKDKNGRKCLAYLGIGEIVESRWFWPELSDKPWLLEANPAWPGSRRVDPRSSEWAEILLDKIAPALLAAGYDGFLLDNTDIGEYLENLDPERFAGANQAVVAIIRALRKKFPKALIVANGGLSTACEAADSLDAVMRESTVSAWTANDDGTFSYADLSTQGQAWLRPRLMRVRACGLPVLALEYADPEKPDEHRRISEIVRKAGHHPYIAERSLMHYPGAKSSADQKNTQIPK